MKYFLAAVVIVVFVFANQAGAVQCAPGPSTTNQLCNPVERPLGSGRAATNIIELAAKIVFILAGFATLLPIIAVTYSGFAMVISQGNQEATTRAKTSLTWAVMGFVLAILSYVIIMGTMNLLGVTRIPDPLAPDQTAITNPLEKDAFLDFIYDMLARFLQIAGVVAVLSLIISGFRYITSRGNEEQAKQARAGVTWSVAGIITILLSYVIIKAAAALFNIS